MSKTTVAVLGGSGYAGAEFLRLAAQHPHLEIAVVGAHSNAGSSVEAQYPGLAAAYPDVTYAAQSIEAVQGCEVVVLGLPHGQSQDLVPKLMASTPHIVDLAADFRLPSDRYERWYGEAHRAPELLGAFSYGLVELCRSSIASHAHLAAPGCYPTATALATAPVCAAGLFDGGLMVNALSGVSGAGRSLKTELLFGEVNENARAYGLVEHRHTGEMEMVLSSIAGHEVGVLFTPHLVPMTRGILVTATVQAARSTSAGELLAMYRDFYANAPAVRVTSEPPSTKATLGANIAHVSVTYSERTNTIVMMSAIDNLTKGTAGQAIQALNLMKGWPEMTGLTTTGLVP
ncbi:MAG: N-acetyl-gamma-glutamyl-phosphate reductase [Acidimicrobiia bacterium]